MLSALENTFFVISGTRNDTGQPAGDIWAYSFRTGSWSPLYFDGPARDLGEIDYPAVAGDWFYFTAWRKGDGGLIHREIDRSDGLSDLQPFLVGTYDEQDCSPAYANDYFGLLKGLHPIDLYSYQDIEIWAAPYVTDPSQLQPFKLGDYNLHNGGAPPLYGGWGHLLVGTCTAPSCLVLQRDVWNIKNRTVKHYVLDSSYDSGFVWGVTHNYVYNGLRKRGAYYAFLVRLAVE